MGLDNQSHNKKHLLDVVLSTQPDMLCDLEIASAWYILIVKLLHFCVNKPSGINLHKVYQHHRANVIKGTKVIKGMDQFSNK